MSRLSRLPPEVRDAVHAVLGDPSRAANYYVGRKIWTRKTKGEKRVCGRVTAVSYCQLAGCNGVRLHTTWSDGHKTRPCSKGCRDRTDGALEIV